MSTATDNYAVYYADKMWALLPEVYRAEDSDSPDTKGPLRELVDRLGAEAAILRRSIDRLWDDAFVETCDDWVISYLAGLLQTNLVPGLNSRGQRIDVAKTIYYRRRKGTLPLLEEVAADITGWEAKVVEFFRRLGRHRHGLDPAIGVAASGNRPDPLQQAQGIVGRLSGTPMGGFADLRNRYAASRTGTAFEEHHYTADLRNGRGRRGWYSIPRLGVFVWRRKSYPLDLTTPVPVDGCTDWYTFDPTGRDMPIYCSASRRAARAYGAPAEEWQMPGPMNEQLWQLFSDRLCPDSPLGPRSAGVYRIGGASGPELVLPGEPALRIWPERGRFHAVNGPFLGVYHYSFSSEIGAGGYDRRLQDSGSSPATTTTLKGGGLIAGVSPGTLKLMDSLTYGPIDFLSISGEFAIVAENEQRPTIRSAPVSTGGTRSEWIFQGLAGANLTIEGLLVSGPNIVLNGKFDTVTIRSTTLDPGTAGASSGDFKLSADGRRLLPTSIFVEAEIGCLTIDHSICGPIRIRAGGLLSELRVNDSIVQGLREGSTGPFVQEGLLDPGSLALKWKARATPLTNKILASMTAAGQKLLDANKGSSRVSPNLLAAMTDTLNKTVSGSSIYDQMEFAHRALSPEVIALRDSAPTGAALLLLNRLLLEEAFPHELGPAALALKTGRVYLDRATILGRTNVYQLYASDSILDDLAIVDDLQQGCVRFSAWSNGSNIPRQYESVRIAPQSAIFGSRSFPQPDYAQLLDSADQAVLTPNGGMIAEGAESGSEMGAFHCEQNAIRRKALSVKLEEYMPIGLSPVIIAVT